MGYRTQTEIDNDVFYTPYSIIYPFFNYFFCGEYRDINYKDRKIFPDVQKHNVKKILDPGAGKGVWGKVAREFFPNAEIVGVEFRSLGKPDEYDKWYSSQDFLSFDKEKGFDLVIGNPPYSKSNGKKHKELAAKFILKSRKVTKEKDTPIIFLLKSAFRHGIWRAENLFNEEFYHTVDLAHRVSFYGNNSSSNLDYSIFVFSDIFFFQA